MNICIIGLGYIGLPTAAMFATHGHRVLGVDVNQKVIDALNKGKIIIEEPNLEETVNIAVKNGSLRAAVEPEESDAFIICVPTPIKPDKTADLTYVENGTRKIIPYLKKGNIVILESTSPPGQPEISWGQFLKKPVLSPVKMYIWLIAQKEFCPGVF